MKKILYLSLALFVAFASCADDEDDKYYKENPASVGATMKLDGGTGEANAKNSVYVDFSTESQLSIQRSSWHLGFFCGNQFGIILNNTIGSRATEAAEGVTVGTAITQADYASYEALLSFAMGEGSFDIVDAIGNDLSKTVIKEGKVYIYNSGDAGLELYKLSVTKKNDNVYILTYALWNETTVKTLEITKDTDLSFIGVSFADNKIVNIQPAKENWDIVWGRNTFTSAMAPGVPFVLSDIVFLNTREGVQAAEIIKSENMTYEEYDETDIASTLFTSDMGTIGSNWRNGGSPTTKPSTKTDRFYVVKDTAGNVYKLHFVSMSADDGGERGYPEIEYLLVKKYQ